MNEVIITDLTKKYTEVSQSEVDKYTKILNDDNYFSLEMNRFFSGSSQINQFIECEAQAMAILDGKWQYEDTEDMLVGSYVHAWSEDKLEKFVEEHPEIVAKTGKNKGELKEKFKKGDEIIDVLTNDKGLYSIITQAEKEVIFTGQIYGLPIKIKVDMLNRKQGYFVDLKIMKSISEKSWSTEFRRYVNFILAWRYDFQMAIYCEILRQNLGSYFTPNIMAASKEKQVDKALISFSTQDENSTKVFVEGTLAELEPYILRVKELKEGRAEPIGCGKCDYCKSIKQITEPVYWLDLGN